MSKNEGTGLLRLVNINLTWNLEIHRPALASFIQQIQPGILTLPLISWWVNCFWSSPQWHWLLKGNCFSSVSDNGNNSISQVQTFPKNTYEYCQEIITRRQSITLENQRATPVAGVPVLAVAGTLEPSLHRVSSMKRFALKKPYQAMSFTVTQHAVHNRGGCQPYSTINLVAFLTNVLSPHSVSPTWGKCQNCHPPASSFIAKLRVQRA